MTPTLGDAVAHGFRHVLDFRGRDTRAWFWPYAGIVLAAGQVVAIAIAIIMPVLLIEASAGSGGDNAQQITGRSSA